MKRLPDIFLVKIKNGTKWTIQNSLKIDQKFYSKFQRKTLKESRRSNPKHCLPEEAPQDSSLYESFDFFEWGIGVAKIAFFLEKEFGGTFFDVFFAGFFLRSRRKIHQKKTSRNSVNENSSKVRRNTSPQEFWKNYAKRRQSQTYT